MRKKLNNVADWSNLPPEMLAEIAIKLKLFDDFEAFRGVCKPWRAAAAKDIFKGGAKLPLLMLSENKHDDRREFYSLSRRKIHRAAVPEAEGKRCMDARFGWVVAIAPAGGEAYLFKPFSSSPTIPLPNLRTFPGYGTYLYDLEAMFVSQVILTANPSATSDFMVFALMNPMLGFWKNGDKNWTNIGYRGDGDFRSIGYYSHKMYAIDYDHRLWSWDPCATPLTQLHLVLNTLRGFLHIRPGGMTPYMVESTAGELLMITRNNVRFDAYKATGATLFEVARIDVVNGQWQVISNGGIGRDAIFIGENASVSVAADDYPGVIKPDSIYFTDDCVDRYVASEWDELEGGKDMGIFDIQERSIERFPVESFSPVCPPFWVFPSS